MRFAYIDSQGNEVPIPSIDALALRIELGAVGPETQLYDAQADHWGPAHTHEIFHTLSRDSEEEGFMAPPPPVAAPPPPVSEPSARTAAPEVPEAEEEEEEQEGEEEQEETAAAASGEFDFGLTLADPPPGPPEAADTDGEDDEALGDREMDGVSSDLPLLEDPEPESSEKEAGGFDFGDLGAGLELEDSTVDDGEDEAEPAGLGDGTGLETEMEFASPGSGVDEREFASPGPGLESDDEELQLETPMSQFEPDSPPGWMEGQGADEMLDFSAVTAEEEATQESVPPVSEAPVRDRRTPKDRPSAPKFKRQRSMSGPIIFVVLLLALGVGGYAGWPIVWPMAQEWLAQRNAPDRPPVVLPEIPAELLPQMRSVGEAAIGDVVAAVAEETQPADAPAQPDDDWLAGVYLGNASQYAGIEAFWTGIDAFLGGLRAAEWQRYHDRYVARVEEAGLDAAAAAQITERADSGFVAAQPQREEVYGQLARLVDAALGLHDFLLRNEEDIVFRPGATSANDPSVDPVLEIAATAAQRDQMLEMFDEITGALTALGSLDRVTRARLVAAMTTRLQEVGLQ